jgi:uncharacterized membrane protein
MDMNPKKIIGIILIIIGVVLPLVLLFFTTGHQQSSGFINTLISIKVPVNIFNKYNFLIPYRIFVALGVVLVFSGIRCFDLEWFKKGQDDKQGQE